MKCRTKSKRSQHSGYKELPLDLDRTGSVLYGKSHIVAYQNFHFSDVHGAMNHTQLVASKENEPHVILAYQTMHYCNNFQMFTVHLNKENHIASRVLCFDLLPKQ